MDNAVTKNPRRDHRLYRALHIEQWVSSDNHTEVHLFLQGTQTYVFGYNPALVPQDEVNLLCKVMGWVVE